MKIEIKKSVKPVKYIDAIDFLEKRLVKINNNKESELIWILRHSEVYTAGTSFKENEILLDAKFKIIKGNRANIIKRKKDVSISRRTKQPLKFRSAGSIFKNPSNKIAAGYLIDQANLKGLRIGDAEISKKHANFIINHGNASSDDIIKLIVIIKNKVKDKFNVNLELEVKILGGKYEF